MKVIWIRWACLKVLQRYFTDKEIYFYSCVSLWPKLEHCPTFKLMCEPRNPFGLARNDIDIRWPLSVRHGQQRGASLVSVQPQVEPDVWSVVLQVWHFMDVAVDSRQEMEFLFPWQQLKSTRVNVTHKICRTEFYDGALSSEMYWKDVNL